MADSGTLTGTGSAGYDVATRGVHHLALTTEDMRATTEFYVAVLGLPLVHAMKVPEGLGTGPGNRGNPPYESIRHYFFDMGNDSLLAFFEIPEGEKPRTDRDAIGGMQHVAFAVTQEKFAAIEARLRARGIACDGPVETMPGMISLYFFDPNGVRLEACYHPDEPDGPAVVAAVAQTKAAAGRELATLGVDTGWIEAMTAALPTARR